MTSAARLTEAAVYLNVLAEQMVDEALYPNHCQLAYVGDFNHAEKTVALNYLTEGDTVVSSDENN